jgi:hypothetical protein
MSLGCLSIISISILDYYLRLLVVCLLRTQSVLLKRRKETTWSCGEFVLKYPSPHSIDVIRVRTFSSRSWPANFFITSNSLQWPPNVGFSHRWFLSDCQLTTSCTLDVANSKTPRPIRRAQLEYPPNKEREEHVLCCSPSYQSSGWKCRARCDGSREEGQ